MKHNRSLLLLTIALASGLTSCVVPPGPGLAHPPVRTAYRTYTTLPPDYVGESYYHGGRYYSGGRYETGAFHDHGRSYNDRYYQGGRYYYGGRHQNHSGPVYPQRVASAPYRTQMPVPVARHQPMRLF